MSELNDRNAPVADEFRALRQRMASDERFRYRSYELFKTVFTTPLTIGMVLGEHAEALRAIVNAVRELHGNDVEITFETDGNEVALCIHKWRDETHLRSLDGQASDVA